MLLGKTTPEEFIYVTDQAWGEMDKGEKLEATLCYIFCHTFLDPLIHLSNILMQSEIQRRFPCHCATGEYSRTW